MPDRFATMTAEHAASFACPTFASEKWPLRSGKVGQIGEIPPSLLGTGESLFALHKDDIRPQDFAKYAAMLGRATIAYANDVYVLFHVRSAEHDRDDVKSLYLKAAATTFDPSLSALAKAKSSHFCTYVGNNTLLTETDFGRKIYVDSNDISVSPHLAYEGKWEPHITAFVTRNLREGDVFLDVGANCGFFTILAAHIVGPTGFVVAIEPQQKLAELVRKSLAINGFDSFSTLQQMAIAEEHGEMSLSHAGSYLGSASLISFGSHETKAEKVKVAPLDDIVADVERNCGRSISPNMIKVDVEGFENAVWRSARRILDRHLTVILEFSPNRYQQLGIDPSQFLDEIGAAGFAINRLKNDGRTELIGSSQRSEIINRSDFTDLVLVK